MSESLLWKLQGNAYEQFGPTAWTKGLVPSSITSNPLIAKQYAELCIAYLQDQKIDPKEPVYLVDLGAGSGRFGYLFLRTFLQLAPKYRYCYIMTDMVAGNLDFLQMHPALKEFECVDFAFYQHAQRAGGLTLLKSGEVVEKSKNPMILLANYYFDTIPQDLFRIHEGRLEEGRISLHTKEEHAEWEADDPRWIPFLDCRYEYVPFNPSHYPKEVVEVLQYYTHLPDCSFLFPTGGIQSLDFFARLSSGKFLLIAGDQGVSSEAQIIRWGEPALTKHSTFSIAVNYHSLAKYFQKRGGMGLLTSFPDPVFANIVAAWGEAELPETQKVFFKTLDPFEPKDYFLLVSEAEKEEKLSLDHLFLLLKLGDFDPVNMHFFYPRILAQIAEASPQQKEQWKGAIEQVWERVYIVSPEEGAFVLNLGVLLFHMEYYPEALLFFQRSLEITGVKQQTLENIAACLNKMRKH